jgi:hypothetical protein
MTACAPNARAASSAFTPAATSGIDSWSSAKISTLNTTRANIARRFRVQSAASLASSASSSRFLRQPSAHPQITFGTHNLLHFTSGGPTYTMMAAIQPMIGTMTLPWNSEPPSNSEPLISVPYSQKAQRRPEHRV